MLNVTIDPNDLAELVDLVAKAVAAELRTEIRAIGSRGGISRPDQLLIPISEAARILSVSERLLWDLTQPRGPIRCVKAGTRILYPVEALRSWIEKESTPPSSVIEPEDCVPSQKAS